jgi:hypothetical protein
MQLFRTQSELIFNFTIYGERHSGTNFLESCISQRFDLPVTYIFDNKHFFGWQKPERITYKGRHTLFIGIVRNPYDWIMAMNRLPHHVPKHNCGLPHMLLNEWYSVHGKTEIMADRNYATKERYKNIFELRKNKCLFLSQIMPIIAHNYILITYEEFIYNHYFILDLIGSRFNLHKKHQTAPPAPIKKREVPPDIKTIIYNNIDWTVENFIGYQQKEN